VHGNTHEVDAALDGRRVDPFDLSDLKVRYQSRDIRGAAIRHQIGRHVHPAAKPETEPWLEQLSVP
jgi:putative transposase